MSTLNSLFDVVRGYVGDDGSAVIIETFVPHSSVVTALEAGEFVQVMSDGTAARATAANYGGAADIPALATLLGTDKQLWLVIDGSQPNNYDNLRQTNVGGNLVYVPWKVTAIRGTYIVKTDVFVTRAYAIGDALTIVNGQLDAVASNVGYRKCAEVLEYNASAGYLIASV